jgi:hypothetical protein
MERCYAFSLAPSNELFPYAQFHPVIGSESEETGFAAPALRCGRPQVRSIASRRGTEPARAGGAGMPQPRMSLTFLATAVPSALWLPGVRWMPSAPSVGVNLPPSRKSAPAALAIAS